MSEAPGRSWRDVLRWFWDTFGSYITTAALALLPSGTAVAIYGRDIVTSSHRVPGWAILIAVALVGPFVLLLAREGLRWRRRTPMLVIEHQGPRALNWSMGRRADTNADVMQVFGDFSITNRSAGKTITPRSVLVVSYRRWGFLPARRHIDGFGVWEAIPARTVKRDRLDWHIEPAVLNRGEPMVARVCLIDHLGNENWTRWLQWPYMG